MGFYRFTALALLSLRAIGALAADVRLFLSYNIYYL